IATCTHRGYVEAIVVSLILAEQIELKHSLINMMTSDQFFGLEKDNPHDHIRVARRWLKKEPSRSIHTSEDLVSKFINEFFPPSRTTNFRNEISNFQQWLDESFHEAWDRYKDLFRACPHHGFTKLHHLYTFYNALKPADQDSLNAVAGGNLMERRTQDVLTIIENKSKVRNSRSKSVISQVKACDVNSNSSLEIAKHTHAVNQQTSFVTTVMTAILKQFQATPPPASVKAVEERCVTCGGAHPYYQCLAASGNTFPELRDNIQGYVSAAVVNYNQGNPGYRPLGSGSLPSNTVANPKGELKAITTCNGLVIDGPTIPTPLESINPDVDERLHINITLADALILIPKYQKMLKALMSNKEKLQELANTPLNENCSAVILKRLLKKLGDPGKYLIMCGFSELKCKALANLESPLRTARALIDVHGEEMILRDSDERLILNMRHDTLSYFNQPQKESINLINVFNNSKVNDDIFDSDGGNVLSEKLLDLDSTKDLHPPLHDNQLSGSTTYFSSSNPLLEEFVDDFALITFPSKYDDDLYDLANLADNFVDYVPEMFTDEHAIDYSSPLIFDEYDDEFLDVESDAENVYDDPFDSKGENIKDSKLLIDELDLPCDFLPFEYDSFISQDFSRVDSLPSTNNEDKIFNPSIISQEKSFKIITHVVQDKKLVISNAYFVLEDVDPPFYEPFFFKVPRSKMLLPFSSENEEKVFKL
nr:reverse transcriptase domain-containing protein [Tanacetum cinerariifolium]